MPYSQREKRRALRQQDRIIKKLRLKKTYVPFHYKFIIIGFLILVSGFLFRIGFGG